MGVWEQTKTRLPKRQTQGRVSHGVRVSNHMTPSALPGTCFAVDAALVRWTATTDTMAGAKAKARLINRDVVQSVAYHSYLAGR